MEGSTALGSESAINLATSRNVHRRILTFVKSSVAHSTGKPWDIRVWNLAWFGPQNFMAVRVQLNQLGTTEFVDYYVRLMACNFRDKPAKV